MMMMMVKLFTFLEKATWNWVEKAPPEEKPLMAMVSGLMLRFSSGDPVPATKTVT